MVQKIEFMILILVKSNAVDKINEDREVNFNTNERVNSNGTINKEEPVKVTVRKNLSQLIETGGLPKGKSVKKCKSKCTRPNTTYNRYAEDAKDVGTIFEW